MGRKIGKKNVTKIRKKIFPHTNGELPLIYHLRCLIFWLRCLWAMCKHAFSKNRQQALPQTIPKTRVSSISYNAIMSYSKSARWHGSMAFFLHDSRVPVDGRGAAAEGYNAVYYKGFWFIGCPRSK